MSKIRSICVFCGASNNVDKSFLEEGKKFGKELASKNIRFVYGGADCGVMGSIANSTLENGGNVMGVFPRILEGLEAAHSGLNEIIIVDDMHTRKMTMFNNSDAFVVFPGGFGTMDETFEVITWKQLETHKKPIIMYNYNGYWDLWEKFTNHIIDNKFASEATRDLYDIATSQDEIFSLLDIK